MINTRNANEYYAVLEGANSRRIILPKAMETAGVEFDSNVRTLKFKFPKVVDSVDLTQMQVRINYINSRGEKGLYIASDLKVCEYDENSVTFSWNFSPLVTRRRGVTRFLVCAVKTDDQGAVSVRWNTTLASIGVLEGLEGEETEIPSAEQDVVAQLIGAAQSYAGSAEASAKKAEEAVANGIRGKVSFYPSVDQMRQEKNFKEGETALTLGYYAPGDGGGALYVMRGDSREPFYKRISISGGLEAELQSGEKLNALQLGCKKDGTGDCGEIIQPIIDSVAQEGDGLILYFPAGKYKFSDTLTVQKPVSIIGESGVSQAYMSGESVIAPVHTVLSFEGAAIENGAAIDANSYHRKAFKNLVIVSDSYKLTENRENTPVGNTPTAPVYSETVLRENVDGIHLHGFGSAVENCCVMGFSGAGIVSEQYNYIYRNYIYQCVTGIELSKSDNTLAHNRVVLVKTALLINSAHNQVTDFRCDSVYGHGIVIDNYAASNVINSYICDYAWYSGIYLKRASKTSISDIKLRAGASHAGWSADSIPVEELSQSCAVLIGAVSNSNTISGIAETQVNALDGDTVSNVPAARVVFEGSAVGNELIFSNIKLPSAASSPVLSFEEFHDLIRTVDGAPVVSAQIYGHTYYCRSYAVNTSQAKSTMYVDLVKAYDKSVSVKPYMVGAITAGSDGRIYIAKGIDDASDWVPVTGG